MNSMGHRILLGVWFLLSSVSAKASFQDDLPEWFVNRCIVLPEHGSVIVHILLPETQAKDATLASPVSISVYDHLYRELETWEPNHFLNAPTPDYSDSLAPAGMQRLVRCFTVPLKQGMNFLVVRNEAGTPSQEVIPLFCARDFRIFFKPSSKVFVERGTKEEHHPSEISTPTMGWIIGEDAQGSLVFDSSLALETRDVRYDRSIERLSCKIVFQNTSHQPVEMPAWGYSFVLRDKKNRIHLIMNDELLYSRCRFCPDDEALQGLVPASIQLQPGQSFERDFSFFNVPLPSGKHELILESLEFPLESNYFILPVVKSGDSSDRSTKGSSEDYNLPVLNRIASEADREKGFPRTEIRDGIKYRVFYFSAGGFIPFEDPVTHQLSSIVVPDVGQPPDGSDDYMEKRRLWIESLNKQTSGTSDHSR